LVLETIKDLIFPAIHCNRPLLAQWRFLAAF
jgi:hypothetical protein